MIIFDYCEGGIEIFVLHSDLFANEQEIRKYQSLLLSSSNRFLFITRESAGIELRAAIEIKKLWSISRI